MFSIYQKSVTTQNLFCEQFKIVLPAPVHLMYEIIFLPYSQEPCQISHM